MPLSNAAPKLRNGLTLREERQQRKDKDEAALRACNFAVDQRDEKKCRVTGERLTADSLNPRQRLNRHHMRPRSTAPSERHNTANVITISQWVSDQIHVKAVLHPEGDANLKDDEGRFCGVSLHTLHDEGWRFSRLV